MDTQTQKQTVVNIDIDKISVKILFHTNMFILLKYHTYIPTYLLTTVMCLPVTEVTSSIAKLLLFFTI